jgi:hypothetical protein
MGRNGFTANGGQCLNYLSSQGQFALLCHRTAGLRANAVSFSDRFSNVKAAVRPAHLPREVAFASRMTPADGAPVAPAGESGSLCRGPETSLVRQSGGGVNSSTDSKI